LPIVRPKASEAELMSYPAGYSVIRVHRQRGFVRHYFSAYRVRIDGHSVGMMAPGETRDFRVPPGEHRVGLTVERLWGSRKVTLQVREGDLAVFTCRPGGGALVLGLYNAALWVYPLCVVLGMVLVPRRYIRLDGPARYESNLSTGMLPRNAGY
jgi:hypothetical protein